MLFQGSSFPPRARDAALSAAKNTAETAANEPTMRGVFARTALAPAARRAAEALDELVDGDTRRAKQEALANGIDEAVAVVRDWIVQWLAHRDRSSTTPVVSILGGGCRDFRVFLRTRKRN
jgi:hypothetical protein